MILSPILGILFVVNYSLILTSYGDDSILAFKKAYLIIPEFCGLCLLILVIMRELFPPTFKWILIIINSFIVILAGGRGPIIITVAVLLSYTSRKLLLRIAGSRNYIGNHIFGFWNVTKCIIIIFILICSMLLLYYLVPEVKSLVDFNYSKLMRLYDFFIEGREEQSASARVDHFVLSYNLIFNDVQGLLFGYGLGSYGIFYNGFDGREYPHNMILEIWVETGLIGIFLFSIFLIYTCSKSLRHNPFVWFVLFLFLNAMKSNSLVDLRLFFGFLALLVLYSRTIAAPSVQFTDVGKFMRPSACPRSYVSNSHPTSHLL